MASSLCFFFFKQKTAYEMRISDWSSDVCSSDLLPQDAVVEAGGRQAAVVRGEVGAQVMLHRAAQRFGGRRHAALGGPALVQLAVDDLAVDGLQIGRASCRETVCQYV